MLPCYEEPKTEVTMFEVDTITTSGSPTGGNFIELPGIGMQ